MNLYYKLNEDYRLVAVAMERLLKGEDTTGNYVAYRIEKREAEGWETVGYAASLAYAHHFVSCFTD